MPVTRSTTRKRKRIDGQIMSDDVESQAAESFLLEEYKEIGANLRHYSNLRFANLTLYTAISGALLSVAYESLSEAGKGLGVGALAIFGILAGILLWVNESRIQAYWYAFLGRGREIEIELGSKQYTQAPKKSLISSRNAARSYFVLVSILWIAIVFASPGGTN
jgi:hypothetical protein